jgi:hypothetical protein
VPLSWFSPDSSLPYGEPLGWLSATELFVSLLEQKPPANTTRRGLLMSPVSRGAGGTSDVMPRYRSAQYQLEITNRSSLGDEVSKGKSAFRNTPPNRKLTCIKALLRRPI